MRTENSTMGITKEASNRNQVVIKILNEIYAKAVDESNIQKENQRSVGDKVSPPLVLTCS